MNQSLCCLYMIMYMTFFHESVALLSIHDNVYDLRPWISLSVALSLCRSVALKLARSFCCLYMIMYMPFSHESVCRSLCRSLCCLYMIMYMTFSHESIAPLSIHDNVYDLLPWISCYVALSLCRSLVRSLVYTWLCIWPFSMNQSLCCL